ncbi:uncharacterized protein TrAtP1_001802 [Trichoderma atroviride]|uniref:uncharacterized protein n=1 Tax=Hypocrea atroviridis TaxID=63577 RepID=UPI00332A0F26|nr:hypothetical protein TrAtP1_001802 [Trichoderma atroviride]
MGCASSSDALPILDGLVLAAAATGPADPGQAAKRPSQSASPQVRGSILMEIPAKSRPVWRSSPDRDERRDGAAQCAASSAGPLLVPVIHHVPDTLCGKGSPGREA